MYRGKSIAVVVPARNESRQIRNVIETMPDFVDKVYVVDDGSSDDTASVVESAADSVACDVEVIRHLESRGVGAAIASGYLRARDEEYEVVAVMAGDGQMDPADLELVLYPVATDLCDYSKGNRFAYRNGFARIPWIRKLGNFVLSTLTKIVSGYWHVSDTQCGYTAIGLTALEQIDIEEIYPRYGCPNDILVRLNIAGMRVAEVPVHPLYDVGEQSQMRVPRVVLPILVLLGRRFLYRLTVKYMLHSGHPLVFAYLFAFVSFLALVPLGFHLIVVYMQTGIIMKAALIIMGFTTTIGVQLLLTSFWMDAEANRHLCVNLSPNEIRRLRRGEFIETIPQRQD